MQLPSNSNASGYAQENINDESNNQLNNQQSYNSPISDEDESIMKSQIEVEETLSKFEMETLRGMQLHIDIKKKIRKYVQIAPNEKPLCNELGIREILGRLRGRFTKIGRLTKKTNEEVIRDMFYFHMSIIDLFTDKADDWDMDESMVKPILDACVELVQDLTYSSREGFTATNLRSQYQRNENVNTNQESQGVKSVLGIKLKR
jgi:hypothetical protein